MRFYRVIGTKQGLLVLSSIVSVLLIVVYFLFPAIRNNTRDQYEQEAARIMKASIDIISAYCRDNEINIDRINDPALTGLVGGEMTGITTTLGHLEAKRTTLDPRFASLVVELLTQAGVKRGDTIAIGSSGSFPALMIASLAAAEAM
ncbi:MAG: poly-gamma-glutamate system protein, partial [Bacteroidia bacterium]